jgi:hypothetical protein
MDRTRLLVIAVVLLSVPLLLAAVSAPMAAPAPHASEPALPAATVTGPGGIWHRVGADEDLRSIARRYYGSGREWRTVQLANDVGMQPEPGCEIWIPAVLPDLCTDP